MRDEDRDPRRELANRLKARLEADGYDRYRPMKGKVKADDPVPNLEISYLELAEFVGALWDTLRLDSAVREARYFAEAWERLDEALQQCGDKIAPVLNQFGLRKAGERRRALHRLLEMSRDYCQLIRSNSVESPERMRWMFGGSELQMMIPTADRWFGETNPGNLEAGSSPHWERWDPDAPPGPTMPGETIWSGPLSTVEAVGVIARWYDYSDVYKAREGLLDARKALKANLDHPIVYKSFPPPYDHFEIPDPAKLGEFRHIDAMGRDRG